jgi:hypothetical protein
VSRYVNDYSYSFKNVVSPYRKLHAAIYVISTETVIKLHIICMHVVIRDDFPKGKKQKLDWKRYWIS